MASILWKLARLAVATGVAEKAVEGLVDRVRGMVTAPRPAPDAHAERDVRPAGQAEMAARLARQQIRLEALEATVRDQDGKLTSIALGLERLGTELRPLIARAAVTFWMALAALALSLVALGLAMRR